jgi:glutamate synthase (NADPH/NADH) small chain
MGIALGNRGNIATQDGIMNSTDGIFAACDMRRGQSLVVWDISEGRKAAAIDSYLTAKANPLEQCHHALA